MTLKIYGWVLLYGVWYKFRRVYKTDKSTQKTNTCIGPIINVEDRTGCLPSVILQQYRNNVTSPR